MEKVIDLQKHRINKEIELEQAIVNHYEEFMLYVKYEVNIREKVRAKAIFSEKVRCEYLSKLNTLEEPLFMNWFAFDYMTIKGFTIYQTYLKHKYGSHLDHTLHALFMVSVLEPYKLISINENNLTAVHLYSNVNCHLKYKIDSQRKNDQFFFARTVPIFDYFLCLGNSFFQIDGHEINQLLTHYQLQEKIGWRTYLKKYAIQYAWNGKTKA